MSGIHNDAPLLPQHTIEIGKGDNKTKLTIDTQKGTWQIEGQEKAHSIYYGGQKIGKNEATKETVMRIVLNTLTKVKNDLDPSALNKMKITNKKVTYQSPSIGNGPGMETKEFGRFSSIDKRIVSLFKQLRQVDQKKPDDDDFNKGEIRFGNNDNSNERNIKNNKKDFNESKNIHFEEENKSNHKQNYNKNQFSNNEINENNSDLEETSDDDSYDSNEYLHRLNDESSIEEDTSKIIDDEDLIGNKEVISIKKHDTPNDEKDDLNIKNSNKPSIKHQKEDKEYSHTENENRGVYKNFNLLNEDEF